MSPASPGVEIRTYPIRRVRLVRELPRYLAMGLAGFGLLASARFAIAPPRPSATAAPAQGLPSVDLAAQAYAALFARRYLTWEAAEPLRDERELEPFVGSQLEPAAGFVPAPRGSQQVEWVEVVQAREPAAGQHVYTVAAQTHQEGLLYLTVGVGRTRSGGLALTGYPALVGPPASETAMAAPNLRVVEDPALKIVTRRALTNYLADAGSDLAADLAPRAAVSPPPMPLRLGSVSHEAWAPGGGTVVVTVEAQDARGARYTLAYELDVTRTQGRWEVSAIQTEPDE